MRCNKVRYRSEVDAMLALMRTQGKRGKARKNGRVKRAEMRAYECKCKGWHLTSAPLRDKGVAPV